MVFDRERLTELGFSDEPSARKDGKHATFHPSGGLARAGAYKDAMPISWELGVDADGKRAWAKRAQSFEIRSDEPAEIAAFVDQYLSKIDADGFPRCSFCNKNRFDVKKLIAGPDVNICDQCVVSLYEIVTDEIPTEEHPKD